MTESTPGQHPERDGRRPTSRSDDSFPSVRIIRGLAEYARAHPPRLAGLTLGVLVIGWMLSGIYTVDNGHTAIVKRFGRVRADAVQPGLQFRLPSPIESEEVFSSGEVYRLEILQPNEAKLQLISGDENLIATSLIVQYKVTDPARFLYSCTNPVEIISLVTHGALLETMAELEVDQILTTGKAQIQNRVRQTTQKRLRSYAIGVSILSTNLQSVEPPSEAASAFRAVQDSRTELARTTSDAEMLREHILSLTRAESTRMIAEARAESDSRIAAARGAAQRFESLLTQYRRSPEQTRLDLYRRTINKALTRSETIVLGPGDSPKIDINLRTQIGN